MTTLLIPRLLKVKSYWSAKKRWRHRKDDYNVEVVLIHFEFCLQRTRSRPPDFIQN